MAIVHEVFAQISEGDVKNIIVCADYPTADYLTKATFGSEAFAVDCLQYNCVIGDKYHDGCFWRVLEDGGEKQILRTPTQEEMVEQIKSDNTMLQLALTEQYEQNLALQDEVSNTQLALAEIYEGMEV